MKRLVVSTRSGRLPAWRRNPRTVLILLLVVILVASTALAVPSSVTAQGTPTAERENLIANSSFERDSEDWEPQTSSPDLAADFSRDANVGFDGDASLRIEIGDTDEVGAGQTA